MFHTLDSREKLQGNLGSTYKVGSNDMGKKTTFRVSWADQKGEPISRICPIVGEHTGEEGFTSRYVEGTHKDLKGLVGEGKSYKEVLLSRRTTTPSPTSSSKHLRRTTSSGGRPEASAPEKGRCFRCFASDHWARDCRDPVSCARCFRSGHYAHFCRSQGARHSEKMQGTARFRPHSMKVFIPLTEGFYTRQQQGRRAVIALTCGRADLGHYPQGTLANDLAGRFGGFSNDFLVTHFRESDLVVFLPQWVQPEDLIRRDGI